MNNATNTNTVRFTAKNEDGSNYFTRTFDSEKALLASLRGPLGLPRHAAIIGVEINGTFYEYNTIFLGE